MQGDRSISSGARYMNNITAKYTPSVTARLAEIKSGSSKLCCLHHFTIYFSHLFALEIQPLSFRRTIINGTHFC